MLADLVLLCLLFVCIIVFKILCRQGTALLLIPRVGHAHYPTLGTPLVGRNLGISSPVPPAAHISQRLCMLGTGETFAPETASTKKEFETTG